MKKLLLFIICFWSVISFAQSKVFIRGDSIYVLKVGGDASLIIENATRTVTGGVLTNMGNGRTAFVTPSPGTTIGSTVINGTAGSVLYIGANGLLQQSNSKFFFDSTNSRLAINTTAPSSRLHLLTDAIGVTQSDANGIFLSNTTAAASGAQQTSPPIVMSAAGWKLTGGAASQNVRARMDLVGVQGSSAAQASWQLGFSLNGAAYVNRMAVSAVGSMTIVNVNGAYLQNTGSNLLFGSSQTLQNMNTTLTGIQNTAIGQLALSVNVIGNENTAVGYQSLWVNLADYNTAVGAYALNANTSGTTNSAFGKNALLVNTTGDRNTAMGSGAMEESVTGSSNTAVGMDALLHANGGTENTGVGWLGWAQNIAGNNNVGVGSSSGRNITGGSQNVFLGSESGYLDTVAVNSQFATPTNSIALGFRSFTTKSNQMVLGNGSINQTKIHGITYNTPASAMMLVEDTLNNIIYRQAIPAGASGVSSITGTANQIAASAATGAVTLSIPSVFSAPGTITAATGLTVTTGGATITAGGLTVTAGGALITAGGLTVTAGTTTLTPLNTIGLVFNSAAGVLSTYAATDHGLQIGNAVGQIASLGLGTTGQVLTSNGAGADPSWQAGGSGVTSVDLAYGITGSTDPITTTGTVIADTTILVNKAGAQVIIGAKNFTAATNKFANATFNNPNSNLVTLGSVSGFETYPGIWFGSAAPSLTNYGFLGDIGSGSTILNGTNNVFLRTANADRVAITSTGLGIYNTSPSVPLDIVRTTEQVRVRYDASNYFSTTVGSTGSASFNLVGTASPSPVFSYLDPVYLGAGLYTNSSNDAAATLTLSYNKSIYIFSGTTTTWTLPALGAAYTNKVYWIKNRGSGAITLNSDAGGNDIYDTSAVNTITINAGASLMIANDGTFWVIL